MSKPKGATQNRRTVRADKVFLWLRQGVRESKIIESLMFEEKISRRTAERAIQDAKDTIGGLGSQASEQQLGLVIARMNHLYGEVSMGEGKNIEQAIRLIALEAKLIPYQRKGEMVYGQSRSTSSTSLAPELAKALQELDAS